MNNLIHHLLTKNKINPRAEQAGLHSYNIFRLSINELNPNPPQPGNSEGNSEGISGIPNLPPMSELKAEYFKRFPRVRQDNPETSELAGLNESGELQIPLSHNNPTPLKLFYKKYPNFRFLDAEAEKASNKIARMAGIKTPPIFTLHKDEDKHVIVQPWIEGKNLSIVQNEIPRIWNYFDPRNILQLALHDVHMSDIDRHGNNYRIELVKTPNGNKALLHPLDYEQALPRQKEYINDYNRMFENKNALFYEYLSHKHDLPIPKDLLEARLKLKKPIEDIVNNEYAPHITEPHEEVQSLLKDLHDKHRLFSHLYNKENPTVKDLLYGMSGLANWHDLNNVFNRSPQRLRMNNMNKPKTVIIGHEHKQIGKLRLQNGKIQTSGDHQTLSHIVKSMKRDLSPEKFIETLPRRLKGYMWASFE